jgi:redox-regulated HSP33 family molecular chaperone
VTITSPASGSTVSGTVSLTARTTGKVNVAYTLDGSGYLDAVLVASPYSFSWDTTKVANGSHKLTAGAWDATSRAYVAGSATVVVTVNNGVKPPVISTGTRPELQP